MVFPHGQHQTTRSRQGPEWRLLTLPLPEASTSESDAKEDQKITIKRNRYSSAERVCQLTTAHIDEAGAHVSILELGGMVKCDADVDDHIRVSVMTLGYKSRRSDSLSVEFDGEITPYEGD